MVRVTVASTNGIATEANTPSNAIVIKSSTKVKPDLSHLFLCFKVVIVQWSPVDDITAAAKVVPGCGPAAAGEPELERALESGNPPKVEFLDYDWKLNRKEGQ